MISKLYYDLNVDYVTQLWEEFGTSISHTNITNVVSCDRYWSLILIEVYEKEGVLVPFHDANAKFSIYQHPKVVYDDSVLFHHVARIPYAMLQKADPNHPILVHYLTTVNPNVQIGVLWPKGVERTSKGAKVSKKLKKPDQPKLLHVQKDITKSVQENVEKETQKEVVPSKTGILKRTKKPAHRP